MIKPGDLVMVVWACCAENRRRGIGQQFVVESVIRISEGDPSHAGCSKCGARPSGQVAILDRSPRDGIYLSVPLPWLRKMPGESTPTEKREEVEA